MRAADGTWLVALCPSEVHAPRERVPPPTAREAGPQEAARLGACQRVLKAGSAENRTELLLVAVLKSDKGSMQEPMCGKGQIQPHWLPLFKKLPNSKRPGTNVRRKKGGES